jgi:hypothetical protein
LDDLASLITRPHWAHRFEETEIFEETAPERAHFFEGSFRPFEGAKRKRSENHYHPQMCD